MRWAWRASLLCATVAAGALAASASEPARARSAQTACADLAPLTRFNTFVLGDHRINNNDVYGRMAIGGRAILNDLQQGEISIGNGLPRDVERLDLIVRGDIIAPGNVHADRGSVVYAGTLQGSVGAAPPSRAANAAASASHRDCSGTPTCCSSTSPPKASTPRPPRARSPASERSTLAPRP